jgi:hypothetical protein
MRSVCVGEGAESTGLFVSKLTPTDRSAHKRDQSASITSCHKNVLITVIPLRHHTPMSLDYRKSSMFQLSRMMLAAGLGIALNLSLLNGASAAQEVTGAGSTFIYPVLFKWATDYDQKTGVKVNYQSIGSGAGVAQIKEGAVDFGATDMPMSSSDLQASVCSSSRQ